VRGLVFFVLATAAFAQPKPIFKIDGLKPSEGGAAELLETFCPGQVDVGEEVKCREPLDGNEIPGFDCPPRARMVTRGHFQSPRSEDALLAYTACEPHSAHGGSTALLTREGSVWKRLWHKPGLITDHCHRMTIRSGREILVCEMTEGFPGVTSRGLFVVDVLREPDVPRNYYVDDDFFGVVDEMTCGGPGDVVGEPITHSYIERVEFHPRPSGDGENVTVFAQYGKTERTAEMIQTCSSPPTKPYRIDFLFDGHAYKVAPRSAGALRVFSQQSERP